MKNCRICFYEIKSVDKVDILLGKNNWTNILGKYTWYESSYCFPCLQAARKMLWRHFISLLLESNDVCRASVLAELKYYDVPIRLTDNMQINGNPIYSLYYKGEMHTTRLETGLSDFCLELFRQKIKNVKNGTVSPFALTQDTILQSLFTNLKVD
jgi:hypothetical protein